MDFGSSRSTYTLCYCCNKYINTIEYDHERVLICDLFQLGQDWKTVTMYPFILHSISLSLFASVIGPFGGFFASGFKRAFKIKASVFSCSCCYWRQSNIGSAKDALLGGCCALLSCLPQAQGKMGLTRCIATVGNCFTLICLGRGNR